MNLFKKIFIQLYKFIFNILYKLLSRFKKTDKNKAVFILSRENKLQGNLWFINQELQRSYPDIKIHFIYTDNRMSLNLFKDLYIFSNAKYLILDDFYLAIYLIKPQKDLKVIQTWHAAGAFKKFGWSTVGTKFGPSDEYLQLVSVHSNYTHVYVSSENVIPYYAEAFNMSPKRIHALGIPRIDLFKNDKLKEKVLSDLKNNLILEKDKVRILIAPTYRATGIYEESSLDVLEEIRSICDKLNNNVQLLFRPHPYTKEIDIEKLKKCPNVIIVNEFTLNDWMLVSDAFITDYSSAIFDYSILEKPFAHFVPDLEIYRENRGFYASIELISDGEVIRDINKLAEWINLRSKNERLDTSRMVHYNFERINNITENIVQHFMRH